MVAAFSLDILGPPLCILFLQCLSVPVELLGTSFRTADSMFGSRVCMIEVTLVLGMPSYASMTQTDFVIH